EAAVADRRPACRDGGDLVYRAARPRRRFARRPLCRRGVLDLVAGALPGPAASRQSAGLAEIRAAALSRRRTSIPNGRQSMATIVGSGDYRYRIVEDWARLPAGW